MDTEKAALEPILVSKKQAKDLLGGLSIRSIEYAITSGALQSRLIGRRRLIVYRSLLAFARRDHPGPLSRDGTDTIAPAEGDGVPAAQ